MNAILRTILATALSATLFAGAMQASHAALIKTGPLIIDTETGLNWLQLSNTVGLSINDINAGVGGWIFDYRYATQDEVIQLLADLGGLTSHDFTTGDIPGAFTFVNTIGGQTPRGTPGTWFSDGNLGATGKTPDARIEVIFDTDNPNPRGGCPGYQDCRVSIFDLGPQLLTFRDNRAGSLLVADVPVPASLPPPVSVSVPEPATLALLGLGLLGLAGIHRRK